MERICDYEQLAKLGKKIKGTRSISELVEESNLSRSFFSKLINQNLLSVPSKKSLKSLSEISRGEVSYDELLKAAGYENNDIKESNCTISFEKAVFNYFLAKPTTVALKMIIDILAEFGIMNNISIEYSTECFSLKCDQFERKFICIPAFSFENEDSNGICFAVLRRLIDIVTDENAKNSFIYIICDNSTVMENFKQMIPPIEKCKVFILKTDDYRNISSQFDVNLRKEVRKNSKKVKEELSSGVIIP